MREYEVKIGGIAHTVQLADEDVERYGAVEHKGQKVARKSAPKTKPAVSGDSSD
ncbi:hypothetical protein [Dietzia sp. ANT_WB102]|uniref:hypothetical protein n=1 Tax=Dietzia sp. ANT_WB102 TaxID=2597345 RepID=UPI00165DF24D|nr:hypothetical protein [Dietzia sp. ANT_WB102]